MKYENVKFEQPFWIPIIAGATARVWAVTLVSPLELIRTKMQSQKLSYAGFIIIHKHKLFFTVKEIIYFFKKL